MTIVSHYQDPKYCFGGLFSYVESFYDLNTFIQIYIVLP